MKSQVCILSILSVIFNDILTGINTNFLLMAMKKSSYSALVIK